MKYFLLAFVFVVLGSCSNASNTGKEPATSAGKDRLEAARDEMDRLKRSTFGVADTLFMDPVVMAKDLYVKPHRWSHWKEAWNYREDHIPQGMVHYSAERGDDYVSGMTMKWKDCVLSGFDHYSFSPTEQLLVLVDMDSTLFYYDSKDRLRQSTTYNDSEDEQFEYVRLYDYDVHGNLLWNAVFFENDKGIAMNHFSTFSYMACDSGMYVREEHRFVDRERKVLSNGSGSATYSFYDREHVLRRTFKGFSGNATGVTFYTYRQFEGKYYETKKEFVDLFSGKVASRDITHRDAQNRVTLTKHTSSGYVGAIFIEDSTRYVSDHETYFYHDESESLGKELTQTKYDSYGNPVEHKYFEFNDAGQPEPMDLNEISYDLLEHGTWYVASIVNTGIDTVMSYDWESYEYRDFLDRPVVTFDGTYRDTPELMEWVERFVLRNGEGIMNKKQ